MLIFRLFNFLKVDGEVSVVVLCHTRELAFQISKEYERFSKYMPTVKAAVFFGGNFILVHDQWVCRSYCFMSATNWAHNFGLKKSLPVLLMSLYLPHIFKTLFIISLHLSWHAHDISWFGTTLTKVSENRNNSHRIAAEMWYYLLSLLVNCKQPLLVFTLVKYN